MSFHSTVTMPPFFSLLSLRTTVQSLFLRISAALGSRRSFVGLAARVRPPPFEGEVGRSLPAVVNCCNDLEMALTPEELVCAGVRLNPSA